MQRIQKQDSGGAELSVGWEADQQDAVLEGASTYAATLARTLESAGYSPRRIEVGVRYGAAGRLLFEVRAEVPDIDEADFVSLANVTLTSTAQRHAFGGGGKPDLTARLLPPPASTAVSTRRAIAAVQTGAAMRGEAPPLADASTDTRKGLPLARIIIGVGLGLLLGVVGLPRIDLFSQSSAPTASAPLVNVPPPDRFAPRVEPTMVPITAPQGVVLTAAPTAVLSATIQPTRNIPPLTAIPATVVPAAGSRVIFAERFVAPLPGWPHDPAGNAWFADGAYRLFARQPGRFVAAGVPLPQTVGDAVFSAQFHKVSGPLGGGYGLIVRAQGEAAERDTRSQAGQYLVVEVGDQGDFGIWQREGTHWIDILPWSHSDAVRVGREPNALTVTTRSARVGLAVNGQQLAEVPYTGLPSSGGVGVFVGGDLNEVALEWLRIEAAE